MNKAKKYKFVYILSLIFAILLLFPFLFFLFQGLFFSPAYIIKEVSRVITLDRFYGCFDCFGMTDKACFMRCSWPHIIRLSYFVALAGVFFGASFFFFRRKYKKEIYPDSSPKKQKKSIKFAITALAIVFIVYFVLSFFAYTDYL